MRTPAPNPVARTLTSIAAKASRETTVFNRVHVAAKIIRVRTLDRLQLHPFFEFHGHALMLIRGDRTNRNCEAGFSPVTVGVHVNAQARPEG